MKEIILFLTLALLLSTNALAATDSLSVKDSAALSLSIVNTNPSPPRVGETADVRVSVANVGGKPLANVIIEIVPAYPFSIASGESSMQEIGSISSYQGYLDDTSLKIVKFRLAIDKSATAGTYELKLKCYDQDHTYLFEKSLSLDVQGRESAEIIHIDKTVLVPGEQSSLSFTINNVGNAPLRDLTFYWENEENIILPVGSDNTRYIKYVDVNEGVDVDYQVIADTNADAGLYPLNLYLTYAETNSGEEKTITTIAGIYVGGGTDFDVAFSEITGSQVSFTVANVGSNPASSVSVIIPQQQGWLVSGSNAMIVGNLNTGDYTVASFSLQSMQRSSTTPNETMSQQDMQQRSISSQNTVTVNIAYTDTMGKRQLIEKTVALSLSTAMNASLPSMSSFRGARQQSFFSTYKWYIILFVVLVVAVLAGIFYRRHKKAKLLNPHQASTSFFRKQESLEKKRK
ncbi:MAG: COG1361 S-layer family protein [archaeon]